MDNLRRFETVSDYNDLNTPSILPDCLNNMLGNLQMSSECLISVIGRSNRQRTRNIGCNPYFCTITSFVHNDQRRFSAREDLV